MNVVEHLPLKPNRENVQRTTKFTLAIGGLMSSKRQRFAILVAIFGLFVWITPPAHAAANWKQGVLLSGNPSFAQMPGKVHTAEAKMYKYARGCPSGATVAHGAIRLRGDYIYVKDVCKDGRSAVARLKPKWRDADVNARVCRNKHGVGTWARCKFNWPEGVNGCFHAGVYNGSTGFLRFDTNMGYEICGSF